MLIGILSNVTLKDRQGRKEGSGGRKRERASRVAAGTNPIIIIIIFLFFFTPNAGFQLPKMSYVKVEGTRAVNVLFRYSGPRT